MQGAIYQFSDAIDYLRFIHSERKRTNARYSLRSWARQLKLPYAATLSSVLNRKQAMNPQLAKNITENLKLPAVEAEYFQLLTFYTYAKSPNEKMLLAKVIGSRRPDKKFVTVELDILRAISDWRKMALLEMLESATLMKDLKIIGRRLGGNFSAQDIHECIEAFIRLGLVVRDNSGKYVRTQQNIASCGDVPNLELRNLQKQYLQRCIDALDQRDVKEREITTNVFLAKKSAIVEAKRRMREFRRELASILESKDGDTVYALTMGYFELLED